MATSWAEICLQTKFAHAAAIWVAGKFCSGVGKLCLQAKFAAFVFVGIDSDFAKISKVLICLLSLLRWKKGGCSKVGKIERRNLAYAEQKNRIRVLTQFF